MNSPDQERGSPAIDAPNWQLAKELFEAAMDCPATDRATFIARASKGDPNLEDLLRRLVASDEAAGSFLDHPLLAADLLSITRLHRLSQGQVLANRFQVGRLLGEGGMGTVYEAFDSDLNCTVALKVIRPEISTRPRIFERFRQEVQLTRLVTHPNVCRTFDLQRHTVSSESLSDSQELVFLSMEMLTGETLGRSLQRTGPLSEAEAIPLLLQMLAALGAAHAANVIHRDLKPSNVMLVPSNGSTRLVLTDFGIATILDTLSTPLAATLSEKSRSGGLLGTPLYMAPEQLEGARATIRTDIYATGLLMFEMLTGRRPFESPVPFTETVQRLIRSAPSVLEFRPNLNARIASIVAKCLQANQKDRFSSTEEIRQAISRTASASILPAKAILKASSLGRTVTSHRRKLLLATGIIVVAVSLFLASLRFVWMKPKIPVKEGAVVLLTPIRNDSGDSRLDALSEMIRQQVVQSARFRVLDGSEIQHTLALMNRAPDTQLDPKTAREVALRTGAPRVMFGTVSRVGDNYSLDLEIEQPDNNLVRARADWEKHWSWSDVGEPSGEVSRDLLRAVRDGGDWIRRVMGETSDDVARFDVPPEDVTTGSWKALQEYARAERLNSQNQPDQSILALRNAIVADPKFALAYLRMGDILLSLNRNTEGYRAYKAALSDEREQRLTRREEYRLRGLYAMDIQDFPVALDAFTNYSSYYPLDYLGWFYRAYPLIMLGRTEEAINTLEKALAVDPERRSAPLHLARYSVLLGRQETTESWIRFLRAHGHEDDAVFAEGLLAFVRGDYQRASTRFAQLRQSRDSLYRSLSFSLLASLAAEQGKIHEAIAHLQEGMQFDWAEGDNSARATRLLARAFLQFQLRRYDLAIDDCKQGITLDPSIEHLQTASSILGRTAADSPAALHTRALKELQKLPSFMKQADEQFQPVFDIAKYRIRGEVLLAEGHVETALACFEKAASLEAPAADREYLARALISSASEAKGDLRASRTKAALTILKQRAQSPGPFWQDPTAYPPGVFSDAQFSYLAQLSRLGQLPPADLGNAFLSRITMADQDCPWRASQQVLVSKKPN